MKHLIALSALLLLSIRGISFGHEGHQPLPTKGVQIDLEKGRISLSPAARELIDVQTIEVKQSLSSDRLRAYASLVAPWTNYAVITSRLSGQVVALHVEPGDVVESGQVIAELESLELKTLQLDFQKTRNDVQLSEAILKGVEPAASSGAVAGQRLAEAELTHQQNLNRQKVLEAKAEALGVSAAELSDSGHASNVRLPVRSPIRGVIVHADLAMGKVVDPTEHLMEVVDLSTLWVRIDVPEHDWHRVSVGQPVELEFTAMPGKTFDTVIDRLGQRINPQTQQSAAWSNIANPSGSSRLRPGMTGVASIGSADGKPNFVVPSQAVFSDGAERYVLVEMSATTKGSEYQRVPIVVGRQTGDEVEILAGSVFPADRIVTRGGHSLSSLFFQGVLRIGPETARTIGLRIETVTMHAIDEVRTFDGRVDVPPSARTEVSSQLAGKLSNIRINPGQPVNRGDILADIASLEFQDLQLELLQANLDHEVWAETLSRRQRARGALAGKTLLETEGQVKDLQVQVENLQQRLLMLGTTSDEIEHVQQTGRIMDAFPMRAPLDGTVVDLVKTLGQVVRADESLMEIHDTSKVRVQAFVSERDSALIEAGQTARIRLVAYPDVEFEGTVARLGPIVGADSRTQAVWIEFESPPDAALQHNMLASVVVTTKQTPPTLAVPVEAVVRDGLRNFVFVRTGDRTFDRRLVDGGIADDRFLEIKSGIKLGESIAVSGVSHLQTAFAAVR